MHYTLQINDRDELKTVDLIGDISPLLHCVYIKIAIDKQSNKAPALIPVITAILTLDKG